MSATNRKRAARQIAAEQNIPYQTALKQVIATEAAAAAPREADLLWAVSADGMVKVEWVDLGEGWSGDYDPEDPDDESLLRYDAYVLWDNENPERNEIRGLERETYGDNEGWGLKDDSSFCTQTPADTDPTVLHALAQKIADELADALDNGGWKSRAEEMSYANPEWVAAK